MTGRIVPLAVAALMLAGCAAEESPLPLVGTLERHRLELIADARERIVEQPVTEGQAVKAGDIVARLEDRLARAELAEAVAGRARAEQRLAELVRGPRQERILDARARLTGAGENLDIQAREYERVARLVERDLLSGSDLDRALNSRELAQAERDQASAQLAELLEGTTPEELGQAQADLEQSDIIETWHLAEAVNYRCLDKELNF